MTSKAERTQQFLRRLEASPPCGSADEAFERIEVVLNQVENEFTSIPFNPAAYQTDGRLYPPQSDSRRDVAGHPMISRYRSKGHNTYIAANGAIRITTTKGNEICLENSGSDGRSIQELMDATQSLLSSATSPKK